MLRIVLIAAAICFMGCAVNPPIVPVKSSLNDFVANSTRVNAKDTIGYRLTSKVRDTVVVPYGKNKSANITNGRGYSIPESSSFAAMSKSFLESRFSAIDSASRIKIDVSLEDFYCEMSTTKTAAQLTAVAFAGGEIPYLLSAFLKCRVTITRDGQAQSKIISTSSEEHFIQGIGTGTNTSSLHQGEGGAEYRLAKAIDDANNKAFVFINKYLEEQQL